MSLLKGQHTVTVTPMVPGPRDRYNVPTRVPGTPVVVTQVVIEPAKNASFAPAVSQDEVTTSVIERYELKTTKPWPGGIHSRIEWNGEEYDQVAEAKPFLRGVRTKHWVVRIQARSASRQ